MPQHRGMKSLRGQAIIMLKSGGLRGLPSESGCLKELYSRGIARGCQLSGVIRPRQKGPYVIVPTVA